MNQIKETDWKVLRELAPVLLERFCQDYLETVGKILRKKESGHERFQEVYSLTQQKNNVIKRLFDDLRRSNALEHLMTWRDIGLLNDEEFNCFSEQARQQVDMFLDRV